MKIDEIRDLCEHRCEKRNTACQRREHVCDEEPKVEQCFGTSATEAKLTWRNAVCTQLRTLRNTQATSVRTCLCLCGGGGFVGGQTGKVEVPEGWLKVIRVTKDTVGEVAVADRTSCGTVKARATAASSRSPYSAAKASAEASVWVEDARVAAVHGSRHEGFRHQGTGELERTLAAMEGIDGTEVDSVREALEPAKKAAQTGRHRSEIANSFWSELEHIWRRTIPREPRWWPASRTAPEDGISGKSAAASSRDLLRSAKVAGIGGPVAVASQLVLVAGPTPMTLDIPSYKRARWKRLRAFLYRGDAAMGVGPSPRPPPNMELRRQFSDFDFFWGNMELQSRTPNFDVRGEHGVSKTASKFKDGTPTQTSMFNVSPLPAITTHPLAKLSFSSFFLFLFLPRFFLFVFLFFFHFL